jgi:large subunit ribosomal protein L40e
MGRHRKRALRNGNVAGGESVDKGDAHPAVDRRLGLNKQVCMSCNARVPRDADSCRKCGSSQLRGKKAEFSDG